MTRILRAALTLCVLAVIPSNLVAGPVRNTARAVAERVQERRAERRLESVGQSQTATAVRSSTCHGECGGTCNVPACVCAGPSSTFPPMRFSPAAASQPLPEPVPTVLQNCPNGKCPLRK